MKNNNLEVKQYRLRNDKKMIGIIFLLFIVSIQIFAFLRVPFLSSINGYTFGMLFGYFNPFVYLYLAYIATSWIINIDKKFPKWFKVTKISYWFILISIVFVSSSTGYIQQELDDGWTTIGGSSWKAISKWYELFTNSSNAWVPSLVNGGFVGFFLYSIASTAASGIGALIASIVLIVLSVSLAITGTWIGLYKQKQFKKKERLESIEIPINEKQSIDSLIENEPKKPKIIAPPKEEISDDSLPFEDPFA